MSGYIICIMANILVFALAFSVCRGVYKNSMPQSIVMAAAMLSMPLFNATPGIAGNVYTQDIIGVGLSIYLLSHLFRRHSRDIKINRKNLAPLIIPLLLLLILPLLSTLLNYVFTGVNPSIQLLGLFCFRGSSYLAVMLYFMLSRSRLQLVECYMVTSLICLPILWIIGLTNSSVGSIHTSTPTAMASGESASNAVIGIGFLFLYRGAIGAWCAAIMPMAPFVFFVKRMAMPLRALIFVASTSVALLAMIRSGSRQGLFISVAVFALAVISWGRMCNRKHFLYAALSFCLIATLLGVLVFNNSNTSVWYANRFLSRESVSEGIDSRNNIELVQRFMLNSSYALFGYGIVPEEGKVDGFVRFTYVDSEVVWTLQEIGIIGSLIYAIYLILLLRKSIILARYHWVGYPILFSLTAGCLMTFGHFFILHIPPSATVVNYWYWTLIGLISNGFLTLEARVGASHAR